MGQDDAALAGLPEPGEPVFYPKVGHCIYRGLTEDASAPDLQLLELEDMEEESRILIPLPRVPSLNLRPAGVAFDEIKEVLSSEFEEPLEDEDERHKLVEELITEGSPRGLAKALKRLHLLRQSLGLSREEEQTRKKIRSWLAAEVSLSRECTRAEAQAFMTRVLQDAMAAHQRKEKEEAKERRRVAKAQKEAEEAAETEAAAEALVAAAGEKAPTQSPAIEPAEESGDPSEAVMEALPGNDTGEAAGSADRGPEPGEEVGGSSEAVTEELPELRGDDTGEPAGSADSASPEALTEPEQTEPPEETQDVEPEPPEPQDETPVAPASDESLTEPAEDVPSQNSGDSVDRKASAEE